MKAKQIFRTLAIVLISSFAFTSCDKGEKIEISQLVGQWAIANDDPNLSVDGGKTYTFNADNTCSIRVYDFLSGYETTFEGTYTVSLDNKLLTLFDGEAAYAEQYNILKLTSKEMKWENSVPCYGCTGTKLAKVND